MASHRGDRRDGASRRGVVGTENYPQYDAERVADQFATFALRLLISRD